MQDLEHSVLKADAAPSDASPAPMHGVFAPLLGWHIFLASLGVLALLRAPHIARAPRAHLNARIFVLGVGLGGLALSLTTRLTVAVPTAIAVWAPKPIVQWWQRRAVARAPRRPANPFRPAAEACVPCVSPS